MARQVSSERIGRTVSYVFVALAVVAAIVALIRGGDDLFRQPLHLNFLLVALSFITACCGLLIAVPVWRRILAYCQIRQSVRDDMRMYCYGALGVALPGSIWSIVGRSALYTRLGVSSIRVATASVVECLVIGVAATLVYALTCVLRPGVNLWQRPEVALGVAVLALVVMFPRILNTIVAQIWRLTKRSDVPLSFDYRIADLSVWIGLESIVVVIGGLSLFVLLSSFTIVPASLFIQIIGVWAIASAAGNLFFWLPGTFVVRDGALVIVLTSIMSLPIAIVFALLARLWSILSLVILAAFIWLLFDLPFRLHNSNHIE